MLTITRILDEIPIDRLKALLAEMLIADAALAPAPAIAAKAEEATLTAKQRYVAARSAKRKAAREAKAAKAAKAPRGPRKGARKAGKVAKGGNGCGREAPASPASSAPPLRFERRSGRPRKPAVGEPSKPGKEADAPGGPDNSATVSTPVDAVVFWKRAEAMTPGRPWMAASRELGVNVAVAQDAFRGNRLPPNLNPVATERFMALRPEQTPCR